MTKQIKRSLKDLLNLKKVKQGETAFDRSERVMGYMYLFLLLIHIMLFVKDATDPSVPLLGLFQLSMIAGGMMYMFAWGLVYRGFLNWSIVVWFLEMSGHSIIMVQLFGSELGVHYLFMLMPIVVFLIDFKLIYKLGFVVISIVAFILVYQYGQSVIPTGNPDEVAKTVLKLGISLIIVAAGIGFVFHRSVQNAEANYQREKKKVDDKNKELMDSIRYAKRIQTAILPEQTEINQALPLHFIYFQPKDIVSGDFYWLTKQKRKVYIAVCDCTGHGVPGAFVSMIGNDLLNQIIIEKGLENPGDILTQLNNGIKSVFTREGAEQQAKDGMDMTLCVFDKDLKTLEFAGANNPLLLIQNGEMKRIKGDRHAIGGETEKDYKFSNHKISLQKGNMLYMFSDGYQDQFGDKIPSKGFGEGKKFMIKRFKELLLSIQDKDMQEQKAIIHKTIMDWKGNLEQVDDILVIGIRV